MSVIYLKIILRIPILYMLIIILPLKVIYGINLDFDIRDFQIIILH